MNFRNFVFIAFILLSSAAPLLAQEKPPPNVLHLTFHKGCAKELEAIAEELSFNITTWFIPDLRPAFFDGKTRGNALYNIGHERAENIWTLHNEYFNRFDVVITSNTVPLSRIFLQNGWDKPLIIWMCNRLDYYDAASLDCDFPDKEYYELLRQARHQSHVAIVAYVEFEHYWAKEKGVDTGNVTITPCGLNNYELTVSKIPASIAKPETFFLPPYHNETNFMDLSAHLQTMGIPNYCGRYNGPKDLEDFKGIIHLPYSFSNLALFENIQLGIPYFIPTIRFFEELVEQGNYFHPNLSCLTRDKVYHLSEWYNPKHADIFTYFDSWEDLKMQIDSLDYNKKREQIKAYGKELKKDMLEKWSSLLGIY